MKRFNIRNMAVAAGAIAAIAISSLAGTAAAGWEDEATAFGRLFVNDNQALVVAYYEDGSFEIEVGNERYTGCKDGAPCDESMPPMPEPEFNPAPVEPQPEVPTMPGLVTLEPGDEMAPITPQIFLPAVMAGGRVSGICTGTVCPSVDLSGCQPLVQGEDCHIGEYEPNTHEGGWTADE